MCVLGIQFCPLLFFSLVLGGGDFWCFREYL